MAPNPRRDSNFDGRSPVLIAHGKRLAHLEGEARGSLLCNAQERVERLNRMTWGETNAFPCPACSAVADGKKPPEPGPEDLDEMEEELIDEATAYHS